MMTMEQMLAAQKSHAETLFGLTHKAFEGLEKLVELNMQTARAALEGAASNARTAMSAKDAVELVKMQATLLQPAAEKAAAYSRSVYEIASATGAEVGQVAQSTAAEMQSKVMSAVEAVSKNAPAGSENAVAMIKSAMTAASTAYEGVQKAVKQASDAAEANLQAVGRTLEHGA